MIDVQALAGDSTDNVPGVPGIGVKTAAELIQHFGDLDTLLAQAETIKQPKRRENLVNFAQQARISRQLVTLRDDAPTPLDLSALVTPPRDMARLTTFYKTRALTVCWSALALTTKFPLVHRVFKRSQNGRCCPLNGRKPVDCRQREYAAGGGAAN